MQTFTSCGVGETEADRAAQEDGAPYREDDATYCSVAIKLYHRAPWNLQTRRGDYTRTLSLDVSVLTELKSATSPGQGARPSAQLLGLLQSVLGRQYRSSEPDNRRHNRTTARVDTRHIFPTLSKYYACAVVRLCYVSVTKF